LHQADFQQFKIFTPLGTKPKEAKHQSQKLNARYKKTSGRWLSYPRHNPDKYLIQTMTVIL
tara:strand:- start:233 stop:415 length:183 start_codon:yes stop_codon:yes gene_type:complete